MQIYDYNQDITKHYKTTCTARYMDDRIPSLTISSEWYLKVTPRAT